MDNGQPVGLCGLGNVHHVQVSKMSMEIPTLDAGQRTKQRIDWRALKDLIPIEDVAVRLLGPPKKREGGRLLFLCPFHEDRRPSFSVDSTSGRWRCWSGCGHGDAADLVMRREGMNFPQAVELLAESFSHQGEGIQAPRLVSAPRRRSYEPPDLAPDLRREGEKLVIEAERRLWEPRNRKALMYLIERGLTAETIRKARLGLIVRAAVPFKNRPGRYTTSGITIPWFDADGRLALLKVRRPAGSDPRYHPTYWGRPTIYPSPAEVKPGRPLVIVEGEFDALLLAQELDDRVPVITLGPASARRNRAVDAALAVAFPLYVATDSDPAGDTAADIWPKHAIQVRPPAGMDWGDLHKIEPEAIRRIWSAILDPPTAEPDPYPRPEDFFDPAFYSLPADERDIIEAMEEREAIQNEPRLTTPELARHLREIGHLEIAETIEASIEPEGFQPGADDELARLELLGDDSGDVVVDGRENRC